MKCLAPSKCLSRWIKVDKWDNFQNASLIFFKVLFFLYLILKKGQNCTDFIRFRSHFERNLKITKVIDDLVLLLLRISLEKTKKNCQTNENWNFFSLNPKQPSQNLVKSV